MPPKKINIGQNEPISHSLKTSPRISPLDPVTSPLRQHNQMVILGGSNSNKFGSAVVHSNWEPINVHTAKCDACDKNRHAIMQRCTTCNHQLCKGCMMAKKYKAGHDADLEHLDWTVGSFAGKTKAQKKMNDRVQSGNGAGKVTTDDSSSPPFDLGVGKPFVLGNSRVSKSTRKPRINKGDARLKVQHLLTEEERHPETMPSYASSSTQNTFSISKYPNDGNGFPSNQNSFSNGVLPGPKDLSSTSTQKKTVWIDANANLWTQVTQEELHELFIKEAAREAHKVQATPATTLGVNNIPATANNMAIPVSRPPNGRPPSLRPGFLTGLTSSQPSYSQYGRIEESNMRNDLQRGFRSTTSALVRPSYPAGTYPGMHLPATVTTGVDMRSSGPRLYPAAYPNSKSNEPINSLHGKKYGVNNNIYQRNNAEMTKMHVLKAFEEECAGQLLNSQCLRKLHLEGKDKEAWEMFDAAKTMIAFRRGIVLPIQNNQQ